MRAIGWVLGIIAVLATLAIVAVTAFTWGSSSSLAEPFDVEVESSTREIITAVERDEQIVLLSTSTQGLHKTEIRTTALGWNVPGTARTQFMQYTYTAKLGIEARDVSIEETGDNAFTVTIPDFIFIGLEDPTFETVLEDGQILSFVSPDFKTDEIVNQILNGSERSEHIDAHRDLLEDQAENFYTGLVHAIDDEAQLTFEFR